MSGMDQLRGISLTQLRYFIRVAERESMTRAAEDLYVAQSAVSSASCTWRRNSVSSCSSGGMPRG
ncbi:LysR family transcriptional regulator [Mycolicibacterium vaccae]|nr:LysR family transcriptional regulator [Mycolicibacterium vaccae]